MTSGNDLRTERTVRADTRVPVSLAEKAQAQLPGLSMSAVIRIALARLAGVDSDAFVSDLPAGRKPRSNT
jgi:hypothetical protein